MATSDVSTLDVYIFKNIVAKIKGKTQKQMQPLRVNLLLIEFYSTLKSYNIVLFLLCLLFMLM